MISRRPLLLSAAAMAATISLPDAWAAPVLETIDLWPGTPPGGGGPRGRERLSAKGRATNISTPYMEVFRPQNPNGAAVLVAGGGGYKFIETRKEGTAAAEWLAAQGITAFNLLYRLPGEGWVDGPKAPLQEAQRAIRLIRAKAGRYGLDKTRIGVLGFSAGGHLMGLAADWSDFRSYSPVDSADFLSARPENAALIYPVVTLQPPYQHTGTAQIMVGDDPAKEQSAEWSVQTHIRPGDPPMFLVQALDDPISNPANTVILAQACTRADVPVELHQLASGGHGFGMGRPGTPSAAWPGWYESWLAKQGMHAR